MGFIPQPAKILCGLYRDLLTEHDNTQPCQQCPGFAEIAAPRGVEQSPIFRASVESSKISRTFR